MSTFSVQCAPAELQQTPPPAPYNPLEHYIPCLHAECTTHYSPAHASFTYYLPQEPYSLSRLHAHCHHHTAAELKEANALCKREWERLRRNAGRRTMGEVEREFDTFLVRFREERRVHDNGLRRRQSNIVVGSHRTTVKETMTRQDEWDWRYTPRSCTQASCTSPPYSPFSNHDYEHYHPSTVPSQSTFVPLLHLCPSCSRSEVAAFEHNILEKWGSKCEWDGREWDEWFNEIVGRRKVECEFWGRAQERVVREKRAARENSVQEDGERRKEGREKKGVWRRLFGKIV